MKVINFVAGFNRFFFGCRHRRTTLPMARTDQRGKVLRPRTNYVVCLKCGTEIEYHSPVVDEETQAPLKRMSGSEQAEERQHRVA